MEDYEIFMAKIIENVGIKTIDVRTLQDIANTNFCVYSKCPHDVYILINCDNANIFFTHPVHSIWAFRCINTTIHYRLIREQIKEFMQCIETRAVPW